MRFVTSLNRSLAALVLMSVASTLAACGAGAGQSMVPATQSRATVASAGMPHFHHRCLSDCPAKLMVPLHASIENGELTLSPGEVHCDGAILSSGYAISVAATTTVSVNPLVVDFGCSPEEGTAGYFIVVAPDKAAPRSPAVDVTPFGSFGAWIDATGTTPVQLQFPALTNVTIPDGKEFFFLAYCATC